MSPNLLRDDFSPQELTRNLTQNVESLLELQVIALCVMRLCTRFSPKCVSCNRALKTTSWRDRRTRFRTKVLRMCR